MGTKSNRNQNYKSRRLSHSGIHRNKRTSSATRRTTKRITKRLSNRKKPHFMHPIIDDESMSSLTSKSSSNYNRGSSNISRKTPSNSSSETSTIILDIPDNENARGKRRTRKNRKGKRGQRGGTCYGNGVGANSYDPNFSIYNTRELELFPYKPTN